MTNRWPGTRVVQPGGGQSRRGLQRSRDAAPSGQGSQETDQMTAEEGIGPIWSRDSQRDPEEEAAVAQSPAGDCRQLRQIVGPEDWP